MSWKAYAIIPIDFGWEFLPTVEHVAGQLATQTAEAAVLGEGSAETSAEQFLADFGQAKELAKAVGWEGDYRDRPRVFWLPEESSFDYAFAWKQDNNGDTFIVSRRPLAWLETLT